MNQQLDAHNQQLETSNRELIGKEQLLSSIFNTIEDIIFLIDAESENKFRFKYINKAFLDTTGLSRSDIEGKLIEEVILEPSIHIVKENYLKSIKEKRLITWEETSEYPAGVKIGIVSIVPVIDENGNCRKLVGSVHDITENKQAEEKLKESEEKYRTLFDNNLGGVYVSSTAGKMLNCNKAFANMMGYSSIEEVLNTDAVNFHQSKEKRELFIQELKAKKEFINFEKKTLRKDGTILYTIENVHLVGDNILQGTIFEITDLKLTQEALKTTNEFNESLIETIPFGMDIVDMEGNILFMNDLLKDAIGNKNPKGKCWEFYKDNHRQCTTCPLKEDLELGDMNINEVHNVLGGRVYEITHKTMSFENKKAMLEIFKDITEERAASKKIRQLSRGIEQSPEMIVITDLEGNIEYVNPRVTNVTGYTLGEIIGKNARIFQSHKTPKYTYKELWGAITKGEKWDGEFLNKRKNGEEYWERASISPITNNNGETINYIAIKEDITEKINAKNELIAAKEKAEEMNRVKFYFFAHMSHELRTPFVAIRGYAELLLETLTDPEDKELAEGIIDGADRLTDTLNKILILTKLEFDKREIKLKEMKLSEVINDSFNLFSKTAEKKNLNFIKNIFTERSYNEEELTIKSDEAALRDILNNLLSNAIKYTEKGYIELKTEIEKRNEGKFLVIKVTDTGIGIPKEKQAQIWDEFSQVSEGSNRNFQGMGLGLAITKKQVNFLGGKVFLESEEDKGSTFIVELPIVRTGQVEKSTAVINENDEPSEPVETNSLQISKTILYVENEKEAQNIVYKTLLNNYTIEIANDVEEALTKIKSQKYDAFLIDINLGESMDGVQLMEMLREMPEYKETPMTAITAFAADSDRKEFLARGFTHYISKPFALKELKKLVQVMFG